MKYCSFVCHELHLTVRPKLTGPVKVIHHAPEGWQQIQRMWKQSVTEWQGAQGLELQIPFIFDQWGWNPVTKTSRNSIEAELAKFERLSEYQKQWQRTPIYSIDGGGIVPWDAKSNPGILWVTGALDLGDDYILNKRGDRCRQGGTINCIQWITDQILQSNNNFPTKPVPATYRIKKGDTLVKIAVYFYGDGSKWRNIATLNHINNPNTPKVGRVIKLPRS